MRREGKPERIGPEETLEQIMNWEILFAVCKCEHYSEINVRHLKNKSGKLPVLRNLEPKLKCKKMGTAAFFAMKMPR